MSGCPATKNYPKQSTRLGVPECVASKASGRAALGVGGWGAARLAFFKNRYGGLARRSNARCAALLVPLRTLSARIENTTAPRSDSFQSPQENAGLNERSPGCAEPGPPVMSAHCAVKARE